MKSVLISINPKWCELIANSKKTIEIRKTRPKLETPFKCYIYQTRNPVAVSLSGTGRHISEYDKTYYYNERSGKVIGEFVCDKITDARDMGGDEFYLKSCLTYEDWRKYTDGTKNIIWLWHISDPVIYEKPKELEKFSISDKEAIRQCKSRVQSYYSFTDTGYIKNGFLCLEKHDWCFGGCKTKPIVHPPQSWCYVEDI